MADRTTQLSSPGPEAEQVLYETRPPVLDSVGRWLMTFLTLGLAALVWWLGNLGKRIRVTDQRLVLKSGLLVARTDYLELYRVTDLVVEEPLGERLLGYGRLVVISSDRSDPRRVLRGIRDPEALANRIRQCIEAQKRTHRVATFAEA